MTRSAANAPTAPTNPNAPICVSDIENGGALSGKALRDKGYSPR
jgi:hypothetical protein